MTVRRLVWRACYGALAKRVPTPDWAFMNYGYAAPAADADTAPRLRPSDERDRLCIQLYLHAMDHADLRGKDVLEVGSGRGGGASYISRYLQPRAMTGMDFSQAAVDMCNQHRRAPGLTFVRGDAQSLPFPASSFDAVVNIESSHCYESMDTFLAEVSRVLRPGGRFFFADLRSRHGVATLQEQFNASGLKVDKQTDITNNVLTALRLDTARKLGLIDSLIPRVVHRPFRAFAGIEGTRNYARFESRKALYLSAQLTKTGAVSLPRLATYGTLAPGRPNHHQLDGLEGRWLKGHVNGLLVDAGWGATLGYPALRLDPDGSAVGVDIFESADLPAHWTRLDAFEGPGYERLITTVHTPTGDVDASIYVSRAETHSG